MARPLLLPIGMTSLRIVMLLVALVICYLLFAHAAGPRAASTSAGSPPPASSEYKQAMDKANAAAHQMKQQRQEADASGAP